MSNINTNKRSFAIIGGDMRQIRLANTLCEGGEKVSVYGFAPDTPHLKITPAACVYDALKDASIVILPLPALAETECINAPFWNEKIEVRALIEQMTPKQILIGGKIDDSLKTLLDIRGIYYVDYFLREDFTVLNAALTAEGGISIALSETATTLTSCNCLVVGFGRIGKLLCHMLDGIGARVCACARKNEAFAWIDAYGYNKAHTDTLADIVKDYDIIFNTVPHKLITEDVLKNMRKDALIIDLASKPGGVDFNSAANLKINTIWALSLPGRTAPITAGDIIKQTIINICDELEV